MHQASINILASLVNKVGLDLTNHTTTWFYKKQYHTKHISYNTYYACLSLCGIKFNLKFVDMLVQSVINDGWLHYDSQGWIRWTIWRPFQFCIFSHSELVTPSDRRFDSFTIHNFNFAQNFKQQWVYTELCFQLCTNPTFWNWTYFT
jgi:hypothetical protein